MNNRIPFPIATRREFLQFGAHGASLLALGKLASAAAVPASGVPRTNAALNGILPGNEPGPFEIVEEQRVPVKMRDGVTLYATLHLPGRRGRAEAERLPAVLVRTPYDRTKYASRARYFATHGYVSVVQDVRGAFESEGEFHPILAEIEDGADTVAWLAGHPRCNGDVGMYGCSYLARTQLAAASSSPPGLKCLIPFGISIDYFHDQAYPDGALQLGPTLRWVIFDAWRRSEQVRADPGLLAEINQLDFIRLAAELPWRRGHTLLARSKIFEDVAFDLLARRTYDKYWQQPTHSYERNFHRFPNIPMLWVSGWYDGYPRSVTRAFRRMKELGRTARQHILLGPWIHTQLGGRICGEVDFGPEADMGELNTQRAFFDRHLKCEESAPETPRVRAFVMGGGSGRKTPSGHLSAGGVWWRGDDWPPPAAVIVPYYLHRDRSLQTAAPRDSSAGTTYRSDPRDPVPSIACPWAFPGHAPRGPADQREPTALLGNCIPGRPLAARADVCVFQTPPLREPVRVLGPLLVRLFVSSDAPDSDFTAKLVDVYPPNEDYPDGYGLTVCEGIRRMRYRESDVELKLMESGRVYTIEIECFPAANLFATAHRIRLDIASSNFPRHEINNNTGDPFSEERRIATNTVHHDAIRRSAVLLPVLPG